MNKDKIIELAREAAMQSETFVHHGFDDVFLERYAELIAEHEREKCAKFVEDVYVRQFQRPWREDLAAAIRARGNE